MSNDKPSLIAPLSGVVVGVAVFVGVNITIGRAIVPTSASVRNPSHDLTPPQYAQPAAVAVAPAGGAYQTICITCHQAEGQGVPGAFPPLAGSEWLIADPETPIRIALLGLGGPIEVKGAKFNALMPPPAGITDEQIAEAVSYARTHFGNTASEVDVELVKQVRASLAGRTQSWTAAELSALRSAQPAASPVTPTPISAGPAVAPQPGSAPAPTTQAGATPAAPHAPGK